MYVAVVSVLIVDSSIIGNLVSDISISFIFVIYFLSAKSNFLAIGVTSNLYISSFGSFSGISTGCSSLFVEDAHTVIFVSLYFTFNSIDIFFAMSFDIDI